MKYINKNGKGIGTGINFAEYDPHPLLALMDAEHLSKEWIQLYFEASKKSNVNVDNEVLQQAIEMCQKGTPLEEYAQLMATYVEKK